MRPTRQSVFKHSKTQKTISRVIAPDLPERQRHETIFREILESIDVGVATCTPAGKILWANARFIQILAIPSNVDPLGARLQTFITPHSWQALDAALALATQGPAEGELKIEGSGSRSPKIRLRLAPVQVGNETIIQLVTREEKSGQAREELKKSEASIHSLSGRLLRLQDDERRRIARDLHDITGQELAVIVMSLSQLARTLGEPGIDVKEQISESIELVRKVEQEVRTLSYVLHPPLLDELGLVSALGWYVEGFNRRTGLDVSIVAPSDFGRLSTEKETALFRVVQEGLTNVLRHSESKRAEIELSSSESDVQIKVEDQGKGVTPEVLRKLNGPKEMLGVGIPGIRERLRQFGGTLRVHSNSRGTVLTAIVPRDSEASAGKPARIMQQTADANSAQTASEPSERKRILIVDDHEMIRHGIRSLLTNYEDVEVCGEAADGIDAIAKAEELKPDLIIMDLSLPKAGGLAATYQIKKMRKEVRVLAFTTHDFKGLEAFANRAGCDGVVLKRKANQDLIRGVRALLSGNSFFSRGKTSAASA